MEGGRYVPRRRRKKEKCKKWKKVEGERRKKEEIEQTEMPAQSLPNPLPRLPRREAPSSAPTTIPQHEEDGDDLAVHVVGDAACRGVGDGVVREQPVLDVEGVDVLAAADDDVFEAAGYGDVAGGVHFGFVAGLWWGVSVDERRRVVVGGVFVTAACFERKGESKGGRRGGQDVRA